MIVRTIKSPESFDVLWNKENPFINHYYTTYALLVPESENFILRSSSHFFKKSKNQEDLKKCFAQEGNHSKVHAQFAKKFKEKNYNFDRFLSLYKKLSYDFPEANLPLKANLIGAAASEQMNTAISVASLNSPKVMEGQGEVFQMLKWHFLEEIEHREVIFNLMKENKVNYLLRVYLMFNFFIGFCIWLPLGAFILGWQDGSLKKIKFWTQGFTHSLIMATSFLASALRFCKPYYNPKSEKLPLGYGELQREFS